MKKEIIISTSFSQSGANSMIKLLKKKYNCVIIQTPKYDEKRGMWIIKYHEND